MVRRLSKKFEDDERYTAMNEEDCESGDCAEKPWDYGS
jgi:hypothetical protein